MSDNWQELIAIGLVIAAFVFLVRHLGRQGTTEGVGGCASCHGCGAKQARPLDLVEITPLQADSQEPADGQPSDTSESHA
jgi:hypothetical protein